MANPLRIALQKEPLRVPMPPVHVAVPVLATLVIVSVLVTGYDGFGHPMGDWQPMPVYISLAILLLALQAYISITRTLGHALYLFVTSLVALIYAANAVFFNGGLGFFHQSTFYLIVNLFLVAAFLVDAIARRVSADHDNEQPIWVGQPLVDFATDFAGFALLEGLYALILGLVNPNDFGGVFFPKSPIKISDNGGTVTLPFPNDAFHGAFHYLQSTDIALALLSAALAGIFVVLVGMLAAIPTLATARVRRHTTEAGNAVQQFFGRIADIAGLAIDRVLLSLRLVLGPLAWLIPAFSLAYFSSSLAQDLTTSAKDTSGGWVAFFLPVTSTALGGLLPTVGVYVLGVLAFITVGIAVALVEHDREIVVRTIGILGVAGRAIALVLAIAIYSLALFNLFWVFIGATNVRPFQAGWAGPIALLIFIVFTISPSIIERIRRGQTLERIRSRRAMKREKAPVESKGAS